jgi:lysophospholipase L1-like esterase
VQLTRDNEFRVIADGTAGATVRYIVTQQLLSAGSYIVSGCTDGGGDTYRLRIGTGDGNTFLDAVTTAEKTITLSTDTLVTVEVNVFSGATVTNKVFPVMVRHANNTDSTYVPPSYSTAVITEKLLLTSPDAPLRILCVGDSISYGARNGLKGYVGGLGNPYQIDGLTGATLSTKQAGVKNIPQQLIDSTYQNPDVIIANGGVNDYLQNAALGTIPTVPITDDTADANLDLSTVCGGAQHLFYNMIKKYTDAQRFFLLTHKTTANAPAYTYGNNLATVTTDTRQANGVDFVNNTDNTFSVFRTPSTEAPKTAGFTVSEVSLEAGTYIFGGLDDGRWTTSSDEYLLLRYVNKATNAVVADITTEPKIVTFAEAITVKSTMYVGKKYSGVYKTITPIIRKCTAATVKQDWTVSQNRALLTQTDIYDAIKKIAALYGVKIIDVFGESMMNTAFSQYVSDTTWDSDHSISNTEYCDTDGIHPLDKGYNQAYIPLIRKALQLGTSK